MYVPSSDGGHALYAHELLESLHASGGPFNFELVSSTDLSPKFDSGRYVIHRLLPVLRDRKEYASKCHWIADRTRYYVQRERLFLKWLAGRPDISAVHLQEWKIWLFPKLVRRIAQLGKTVLATVHNVYPHRYPTGVPKALIDGLGRRGCAHCSGLFVHTHRLADELRTMLRSKGQPIHVVPHVVWSCQRPGNAIPIAQRLSLRKLLFFGVLRRNKGLHIFLQAAQLLPDVEITIAGSEQEPDYFQEECLPLIRQLQARGHRIDVRIRYISDAEAAELFATHSAVVMPYTDEFMAQSGVVYMAIAHDLPVISTRAGGLGDLLDEFPIGTLCDEATPQSLAVAIRELFSHPRPSELQRHLDAARSHYSWESAAMATMRGYSASVLAQGVRS